MTNRLPSSEQPLLAHLWRCVSCGQCFPLESGALERCKAEAQRKGMDPAECELLCDPCYALTILGAKPGVN